MKAFLSWHQVEFPKTHDLEVLLDLMAGVDLSLAESLRNVAPLTDYAVGHRYPGELPEPTAEDATQVIAMATAARTPIIANLPDILSG